MAQNLWRESATDMEKTGEMPGVRAPHPNQDRRTNMASPSKDGYFDLEFNADRTQVFATIYPPRPGGKPVTAQDILTRLRERGVMYGYRENDILRAIHQVDETQDRVVGVLVAQGLVPQNGEDGQIIWKVDQEVLSRSFVRRPDGLVDYFALDTVRMVRAGQHLASVIPPRPGTPGKTLTAPLRSVPQNVGKEADIQAGRGVRVSEDGLHFYAAFDGFAEFRRGRICVLPLQRIEDDLPPGEYRYSGGAVILGGVKGASVQAQDVVAVRGTTAGAIIRTHADVYITRAARSKILTEGNVYVLEKLLHCEVNTRRKIIALDGASLIGGHLTATEGVEAADLGSPDFTETRVTVGVDRLSAVRLQELEEEIAACELNVQKIGQALRPLTTVSTEALPEQKKQLVQTLLEQRRGLEAHIRELHSERRLRMMSAKARLTGTIAVSGTVYPGVWLTIHTAEMLVENPLERVVFAEAERGRRVGVTPLSEAQAA